MAGLLLSTVGRLWLCGEVWIGSSNYSTSQSLSAWWTSLGFISTIPTEIWAATISFYNTPRFISSCTKCPSSCQPYNALYLSPLFSLSFCHALWIIITVIKVSRPLWGHHFSVGRSGNYRSCWQCFSNCTSPDTKANTKRPRDYTAATFWRSMHGCIHHYVLPLHSVWY